MFPKANWSIIPPHLRWYCETVEPGTSVTGVLAGKVIPVRTHWDTKKGQTLPCLHAITSGKLHCNCTVKPISGVTTGYTPIITREGEKIVVPASALVGYQLDQFVPGKFLKLHRSKKRCAPLKIEIPSVHEADQAWIQRMRPACIHDISEYLCHLWQIRALTEHFGYEFRPAQGSPIQAEGVG